MSNSAESAAVWAARTAAIAASYHPDYWAIRFADRATNAAKAEKEKVNE